jgi:hypothetical protein
MKNRSRCGTRFIRCLGILLALVSCAAVLRPVAAAHSPVRVMIIVAAAWQQPSGEWRGEAERWVASYRLTRRLAVPGLSQPVVCNEAGVCLAVVGEGPVASAAATMTVGLYPGLDLAKTYILIDWQGRSPAGIGAPWREQFRSAPAGTARGRITAGEAGQRGLSPGHRQRLARGNGFRSGRGGALARLARRGHRPLPADDKPHTCSWLLRERATRLAVRL